MMISARKRLLLRGECHKTVVPLAGAPELESRRARPFSLESSGSTKYDAGLSFDKWEISIESSRLFG